MKIPDYRPHPSDTLHTRLVHALTRYDRQQESKRGYNPYALGLYLEGVKKVEEATEFHGVDLRSALVSAFSDRLLDVVLKACGLPKATQDELR